MALNTCKCNDMTPQHVKGLTHNMMTSNIKKRLSVNTYRLAANHLNNAAKSVFYQDKGRLSTEGARVEGRKSRHKDDMWIEFRRGLCAHSPPAMGLRSWYILVTKTKTKTF